MSPFFLHIPAAYLVGSIPFGLLIGRARGIDLRQHGSGNIGATNAWRVLGPKLGATCFALDFAKGFAPTLTAGLATGAAGRLDLPPALAWGWLAVAAAAILGHVFPVWLRFKGGKGVATGAGAMLGVYPILTLAAAGAVIVWIISARLSRYVSLSSCLAAICMPIFAALVGPALRAAQHSSTAALSTDAPWLSAVQWPFVIATAALAALVLWTHRTNLARIRAGTERRIGQRATPAPSPTPPSPAA